jgi:phage-related protein
LSRAAEVRPILLLLLTREVAIIENSLYIEKVAQGANPRVATISWEGDSWNILKSWPKSIRLDFGTSLREMQQGRPPRLDVRPMQSIGDGVFELKDSDERAWYRMIYLARKNDVIFVLDCFEKDSRKTEKHDIKRAKARFKQVRQRLMEERKDAKHKPAN